MKKLVKLTSHNYQDEFPEEEWLLVEESSIESYIPEFIEHMNRHSSTHYCNDYHILNEDESVELLNSGLFGKDEAWDIAVEMGITF